MSLLCFDLQPLLITVHTDTELHVFDLDGTLLQVNSFRLVTKRLLRCLVGEMRVRALAGLVRAWLMRRIGRLSHLQFKHVVVNTFEKCLTEEQKSHLVAEIVDRYSNRAVLAVFCQQRNRVICTAAPFSFAHRMSFAKDAILISALDPARPLADPANCGAAKVANMRSQLGDPDIAIASFYTDSIEEDGPLIELASRAFLVRGGELRPIK